MLPTQKPLQKEENIYLLLCFSPYFMLMVRLPCCDYDILLLAFIFSNLNLLVKILYVLQMWSFGDLQEKKKQLIANCEILRAFKTVLFHCIHLSRNRHLNNMKEEIQQYAIYSKNMRCFKKMPCIRKKDQSSKLNRTKHQWWMSWHSAYGAGRFPNPVSIFPVVARRLQYLLCHDLAKVI